MIRNLARRIATLSHHKEWPRRQQVADQVQSSQDGLYLEAFDKHAVFSQ